MSSRACARLWVSSGNVHKQTHVKKFKVFYHFPSLSLYPTIINLKAAVGETVISVEMTKINCVDFSEYSMRETHLCCWPVFQVHF